jgi:hypothetical protein
VEAATPEDAGRLHHQQRAAVVVDDVGSELVAESNKVEAAPRRGEIVEVRGADGGPPYVVRWSDGHEGLVYPGADAHVVPSQA